MSTTITTTDSVTLGALVVNVCDKWLIADERDSGYVVYAVDPTNSLDDVPVDAEYHRCRTLKGAIDYVGGHIVLDDELRVRIKAALLDACEIDEAWTDLEREDMLAFRQELAAGAPDAPAVIQDTGDKHFRLVNGGEPVTVADALAYLDELLGEDEGDMIEVLVSFGEFATGDDEVDAAQRWQAAGFGAADAREWLEARCFDPDAAAKLRAEQFTPADAAKRTSAGTGDYEDTLGYKVSNGDLGVEDLDEE